jgi:hypothetical protein
MTPALYILTCVTTLFCAVLLLRGFKRVRKRLLLWSGLCFLGLTLANAFVIADLILFPSMDLYTYRLGSTAVSMVLILYGLIGESR